MIEEEGKMGKKEKKMMKNNMIGRKLKDKTKGTLIKYLERSK